MTTTQIVEQKRAEGWGRVVVTDAATRLRATMTRGYKSPTAVGAAVRGAHTLHVVPATVDDPTLFYATAGL